VVDFEGKPHDFLTQDKDEINYNEADKLFQLPFPIVAIEDDSSLVILMDSKGNQIGLKGTRYFVDIINMNTDSSNFVNHLNCEEEVQVMKELARQQIDAGYFVSKGQVRNVRCTEEGRVYCEGLVDHAYFLNNKQIFFSGSDQVLSSIADKKYIDDMLRNPLTAYEELIKSRRKTPSFR
jgi:hypothetical protein